MSSEKYLPLIKSFVNLKLREALSLLRKENKIIRVLNSSLWDLPSPSRMSYFWNFGSTLGACLLIQLIRGIFLSFHYIPSTEIGFISVLEVIKEVWRGWLIRLIHINGASIFFLFIYIHICRGIFFMRRVHKLVWNRGVFILILLMAISFLGYVLPWGQISYWAVAVITNLFSVVPLVGDSLVYWIWGSFSVRAPTLNRFYSLHFVAPFILTFLVFFHLLFLHQEGSRNPLGLNRNLDKSEFHPYFTVKDVFFIVLIVILFLTLVFFLPFLLGDPVNNIPANFMQTPAHIQPEWYFLPSYAILRSLPSKTSGVLALAISVAIFFLFPLFKRKFRCKFSFARNLIIWRVIFNFIFLIKIGSLPAEEPYVTISKIASMIYFRSLILLNI